MAMRKKIMVALLAVLIALIITIVAPIVVSIAAPSVVHLVLQGITMLAVAVGLSTTNTLQSIVVVLACAALAMILGSMSLKWSTVVSSVDQYFDGLAGGYDDNYVHGTVNYIGAEEKGGASYGSSGDEYIHGLRTAFSVA